VRQRRAALRLHVTHNRLEMPDDEARALVRRLCHYLRDNPLASDRPEGIAHWWLHVEWLTSERVVGEAIAHLVSSGLVEAVHGSDGRIRYRRARGEDVEQRLAAVAAEAEGSP